MSKNISKTLFLVFSLVLFAVFNVCAQDTTEIPAFPFSEAQDISLPKDVADESASFFTITLDRFTATFLVRLLINLVSMIILIRLIYFPVYRRSDYFFTFFMFNITIFIITYLLNTKSSFSMGAAFGLFAIFSMLRYRTEDISARDMTYLFSVITLGLISSVNKGNVLEIIIINAIIIIAAYLLEGNLLMKTEFTKTIEYENIELIKPENRERLLLDLKNRTGLEIHKINIKKIDFLRDSALIKVYYHGLGNNDDA